MALLNQCMKFKNFFCQKTSFEALRKCHLQKVFIPFSMVRQIQDLGQSKYKLRLFSKRTHGISKILFNLGFCEFLARLESKIRKCLFFDVHYCKKIVCICISFSSMYPSGQICKLLRARRRRHHFSETQQLTHRQCLSFIFDKSKDTNIAGEVKPKRISKRGSLLKVAN